MSDELPPRVYHVEAVSLVLSDREELDQDEKVPSRTQRNLCLR
jgi:hypothetical protein